jgi:hypothetical protein
MARCTLLRRGLVKKHSFTFDTSLQFVATLAADVAMRALQYKRGLLVMVKQHWPPSRAVMTPRARGASCLGKLLTMDVRVAGFTLRWRHLEIHMDETGRWARRFVTIDALRRLVGAAQRKGGFRMVELRKVSPCLSGMAGFAFERSSIRCNLSHESQKSPLVRIGVTTLASVAAPVVLRSWFRFETRRLLVTFAAWNCHMASR